ncbi:MFS transporter [Corynebacterium aquatimens]|uniref:MFS family permease n=1 Tax=Corynebacterium aquatimens TaxID=1190508 RepID=A0A931DTL1_9CORY|nr:MFS transporter [Corynebacterium aquatimens]MBG6121194.1 MFS family permease [Corynebacterium aquatimens]WJY66252.1 Inner membrane metabolite transport protein YhjE [Corynebacterium aquatimens]
MTVYKVTPTERRRVVAATTVGTAIEWYDFFLYAATAGLVFKKEMFGPLGPSAATLVAFLTVGLPFFFRPFGAFLAGHFADRIGRRKVLMITLIAMGSATTLMGLLPTYATIGIAAPIILVLLRVVQGISAGGEWGSAVLLTVEHAPVDKRGLFGAGPQVGAPAGLLLSSGAMALMSYIAPGDAFVEWGWRIPFLFSLVLLGLGIWIRHGVEESPVFEEMAELKQAQATNPVGTLFKEFTPVVIVCAALFAANNALGYMTTGGYIQNYTTSEDGLGMERGPILTAVTIAGAVWMVSTFLTGWASDKLGRKNTLVVGFIIQGAAAFALFPLVNKATLGGVYAGLIFLALALGFTYGQISTLYAEFFPASVRGAGTSITYAIGSIFGGAFAPFIASWIFATTGSTWGITAYLVTASVIGLIASLVIRERKGIPLGHDNEQAQRSGHFVWQPATC